MALGRTRAVALVGLDGSLVEVEADISSNLPGFVLIGLPDTALGEARDRVRAAATNSGCPLPARKLTVNLSPASLPKQGSGFDLAIAVATLAASGQIRPESVAEVVHIGELSLDGRIRPVSGVLPAVLAAARAGASTVMVPSGNADEASLVPDIRVVPIPSLREAAIWHGGNFSSELVEAITYTTAREDNDNHADLSDLIGNRDTIDALIVAAAGGHHSFLLGPPGAGKTMVASRLPGILPDLKQSEALQVASVRSLSGIPIGDRLPHRPPWEAPHHSASAAALIGGGSSTIRPGAAVRASHGVLFLDEAPEFSATVLDSLRQPLESGSISIHRVRSVAHFPARFQLILAANPCPCGNYGADGAECTCPPHSRRRYLGRLSGPLLDRIDIQVRVPRVTAAQLRMAHDQGQSLSSTQARQQVDSARAAAAERLAATPWTLNSQVAGSWLRNRPHRLGHSVTRDLDRALERGGITMRGYDRVLRLAWTIADCAGATSPAATHLGQALYLRRAMA